MLEPEPTRIMFETGGVSSSKRRMPRILLNRLAYAAGNLIRDHIRTNLQHQTLPPDFSTPSQGRESSTAGCGEVFLSNVFRGSEAGSRVFVKREQLHQIVDVVTALVASGGFRCLDAEFEAHSRTLRLFIDHPQGVDLDACAKVSDQLVNCADLDPLIPGEFNLEISSPGIERPVRTIEDFKAAKDDGCKLSVNLTEKYKNRRKGVGLVTKIDEQEMISMSTTEGSWTFPWNMVLKATRVVDWTKVQ